MQAGVGAPAGPAPTLGRCLWQAAQNPESHADPRAWSGPSPRMSLWPCPQACFNPDPDGNLALDWGAMPGLCLRPFFFNKVIKGQSLELKRCELEPQLCPLSTG